MSSNHPIEPGAIDHGLWVRCPTSDVKGPMAKVVTLEPQQLEPHQESR